MKNISRAEFFSVTMGGAAAAALLSACGSDEEHCHSCADAAPTGADARRADASTNPTVDAASGTPDAAMATCADETTASIGANHGHVLVVAIADIAAGVDKTYEIQGSSPHPHSVTVTGPQFTMLAQGATLSLTSTNNSGHSHSVTLTCA